MNQNDSECSGTASASVTTSQLITMLVTDCFGSITVSKDKWNVTYETEAFFPSRSYFSAALNKKKPPINKKAAAYIEVLHRLALTANTRYNRYVVSARLNEALKTASGNSLEIPKMEPSSTRATNLAIANMQLALLAALLELAIDQDKVHAKEFSEAASKIIRDKAVGIAQASSAEGGVSADAGIGFLPDSVKEADFATRITEVDSEMLIHNFHGTMWFQANRSSLEARIARGNINIRVILADDNGPFFTPYAKLKIRETEKEKRKDRAKQKVQAAQKLWEELVDNAKANGAENISLRIYLHSKVPAYSACLFDHSMVLTPTKMSSSDNRFPALVFEDTGEPDCAFACFSREIEALVSSSRLVSSISTDNRPDPKQLLTTRTFLKDFLFKCFNMTTIDFSIWDGKGNEIFPEKDFFSSRLLLRNGSLIDSEAADYLTTITIAALEGRSPYDCVKLSIRLTSYLGEICGLRFRKCAFSSDDSSSRRIAKKLRLVNAVSILLAGAVDSDEINLKNAKESFRLLGML